MAKMFLSVGATTTESIDAKQPVWVLLPETTVPAVVATYAHQIFPGTRVLVQLGSVKNLFSLHFLPRLGLFERTLIESRHAEYPALRAQLDAFAGDGHKRARIFISFLAAKRSIDRKLYPILDKVSQKSPLTRDHLLVLVDALYATLRKTTGVTFSPRQKIIDFLQTGNCDTATLLWLAVAVDPRFALLLWHDSIVEESRTEIREERSWDTTSLEYDLRQAIDQIRSGGTCPAEVRGVDLQNWLATLIGSRPRQRFFVEAEASHQGMNKTGCLTVVEAGRFQDFGEDAPRLISLDKLSRAVTAFDRTLSHLVIRFCLDDPEMTEITQDLPIHSGMLVRGLLGDSEAMRTLYPWHTMIIPNQPALSERVIEKTCQAVANGTLARVCARHYGIPEAELHRGIERLLIVHRKLLPLVPLEVHRLADAIDTRLRMRKEAEALEAAGGRSAFKHRAMLLDAAMRSQAAQQFEIARRLKADFHVDRTKLFYIDNLLIDRIKALFGSDLEFMRCILAGYIKRHDGVNQSPAVGKGSAGA
jgi:hypothetical protein